MRPVIFHAAAQQVIRGFPRDVRDRLGRTLYLIQVGERPGMPLVRQMPSVAPGVAEIRLSGVSGEYRVFYFAHLTGILIVHAFAKKTNATPRREIETARGRLKELLDEN